jgi:tetratricopeptide (TPR) repeat protein
MNMHNALRVGIVILIILLAVFAPVIWSGYSELRQASNASSHLESAEHYLSAAQRLLWRRDLYELAGHAYYLTREYSLADATYQKAFQYNALSPNGWVEWGDVNYLRDDHARAAEIWRQGLSQQDPSGYLYLRLARIYEANGDYSHAIEYLQKYVPDHLEDASAHYQLGLLLTLSSPNEALSHLINASQLDHEFDPAVQTLRTALNLALINNSPSDRLVIIGRGLGLVNEWELAHAAFEEAVKSDEDNAEAWAWFGEANQQTGEDEALTHLDRALDLNPNSSIVRGLRGLYFQRIGNHREALKEFQFAANLESDNPAWFVSIGESYSRLGDLIRALEAYQYATTLAPEDANYYLLLAGFCAQNDTNVGDVGVSAAQKAVQLTPEDPRALDVLGWTYLLAGRYAESERMLLLALEHDPQLASAHLHLALLYLQKEDYASMQTHLIQARDLRSSEAEALLDQYFP